MPHARKNSKRASLLAPLIAKTFSFSLPKAPATSFPAFLLLPPEIANRILILACRLPPLSSCKNTQEEAKKRSPLALDTETTLESPPLPLFSSDAKGPKKRSPLALDTETTLSLARVSKSIGELATSLLWDVVRITKPSALLELYAVIEKRPELAQRIKHLHVGGEEAFRGEDRPLVLDFDAGCRQPGLRLMTSLHKDEAGRVPGWTGVDNTWPVGSVSCSDRRPRAVVEALQSALSQIDLDPFKRGYGRSGARIGLERWATRTFELQACLDLYLMELRRLEAVYDKDSAVRRMTRMLRPSSSAPSRYPRLVLSGFSSTSNGAAATTSVQANSDVFVLSRAQIWRHLTRRGGSLDVFDHPILFARTGFRGNPINDYGRAILEHYLVGPYPELFQPGTNDDAPQHETYAEQEEELIESQGLVPKYTICGINIAVTTLISRSTNVINLSLTGTLDLCLSFEIETFKTIRSLSLGPLFPLWMDTSLFKLLPGQWRNLENLRVCGAFISELEAEQIAGKYSCFPALKRFQWEMVSSCKPYEKPEMSPERWIYLIQCLQGKATPATTTTTTNADNADETLPQPPTPYSRLIEVRLHHATCKEIFALLPKETRKAWKANKPLTNSEGNDFPNRIRITESDAAKCGSKRVEVGHRKLHFNARKWFEECYYAASRQQREDAEWMPSSSGGYSMAPRRKPRLEFCGERREVQEHSDGMGASWCRTIRNLGYETESEGEGEGWVDWARIRGDRDE